MTDPVSLQRMNLADDLVLLADVVGTLKTHHFITISDDGHYNFQNPGTGELLVEAQSIESLLKTHGLQVPPNVDRIIQALPLILPLLGVQ